MNNRNQLKWVALLAIAVILPTVSLLWFMSRVVANERLVVQQKLATIYQQKLEEADEQVKRRITARFDAFSEMNMAMDPYGLLRRLVLKEHFQGVVIWSLDGKLVYPSTGNSFNSNDLPLDGPIATAWQLEFVEADYAAAAGQYERLAAAADPRALAGEVRCLAQLDRWDEAMDAATKPKDVWASPARLLLLSLLQKYEDAPARQEWMVRLAFALENDLFKSNNENYTPQSFVPTEDYLPAGQNLFVARKLLDCMQGITFPEKDSMSDRLGRLADAEEISFAAANIFPSPAGPYNRPVPVMLDQTRVYVHRYPISDFGEMMIILSNEGLASELDGYRAEFDGSEAQFRIFDAQGNLIAGELGEGIPAIASAPLPHGFPDGRVELFFADGDILNKAAGRQITVYIWTAVLVILLMLVVGLFAIQAVGRQIRLNKIKNDFIATVSHELKTPLASMRLLVDTLLEGRTRDEQHAEQYLHMIARENERLTRMIENFLSFSRMERNKNAFTMASSSPAEIAAEAIEAVCTKFETNGCKLTTRFADDLPEITADRDAIVTVLINLLDNACKYTAADKRLELAVFTEAGEVCFAVSDNGIGLSRRQIRKIFGSFYQVDNSLARTTEGCGLGLSIVQFIVNAHKGRIDVESEPAMGSTFTVHLPISRKNGDRPHHHGNDTHS